jgi:outer membrane protein assembly factor BamC
MQHLLVVLLAVTLGACASRTITIQDKKIEYQQAYEVPQLEIPPGLSSNSIEDRMVVPELSPNQSATYSSNAAAARAPSARPAGDSVLPDVEGVRIERLGDKRWLVVDGEPSEVWGPVRQFWLQLGFLISREDQALGILETEWAENRADIPEGMIRRVIGRVPGLDNLYDSSTRDKFRVRLEKGAAPGTTEVYLTHRGLEQVAKGETFVWQSRPAEPELEAELLTRMMMFWGAEEQRVRQQMASAEPRPERARVVGDGDQDVTALMINEEFARAWRRTGVALDRIGFAVEDRDRSRGTYRVRYQDIETGEKGLLSRLAFWQDDKPDLSFYNISLRGYGPETRLEVLDVENALVRNQTSRRILTLLYDELK